MVKPHRVSRCGAAPWRCEGTCPGRRRRPGITLVEVLVAVVVLSIGVLGATATAVFARRLLREAHAAERAIAAAALVLDSLVRLDTLRAGERTIDGKRFRWVVREDSGTTLLELVVEYHDGTGDRRLVLGARHTAPPPGLGGAP